MNNIPDVPQSRPPAPSFPPGMYAQTSSLAIVSLITGLLSWFLLPLVGAVIAILTGHMAKGEIRSSMGRLTGDGLATAGLILGYLHIAAWVVFCCLLVTAIALGVTLPFVGQSR